MYTIKPTVFYSTFNRFLQNQAPADKLLNRNRAQAWPEKAQKCTGQHSGRPTEPFLRQRQIVLRKSSVAPLHSSAVNVNQNPTPQEQQTPRPNHARADDGEL
jgi:hypothetical protein